VHQRVFNISEAPKNVPEEIDKFCFFSLISRDKKNLQDVTEVFDRVGPIRGIRFKNRKIIVDLSKIIPCGVCTL
jgi:hypothetical protein